MQNLLMKIERDVMNGMSISLEDALQLAQTEDVEALFASASMIREKYKKNKIELCSIINAKSGQCPEDCRFCAQSVHYATGAEEYPLIEVDKVLQKAQEIERQGVHRFSLVTSGKCLMNNEFEKVVEMIKALKKATRLCLCASLGSLSYDQALRLKAAGLSVYHHNVETSSDYFPMICTTHFYRDRVDTVRNAIAAGLEPCCGGIIGMGEGREQRVRMAFEIKELGVKSIPINILTPITGTPLENKPALDPQEALRTISVFRFINPDASIRYAAGRNALGARQKQGFRAGISAMMVGDFLTTCGNKITDDLAMIKELGLEV